jgi:hypothetical protein
MAAKDFPPVHHVAVTKMVVARLGTFAEPRDVVKSGATRNAGWAVSGRFYETISYNKALRAFRVWA